MRKKDGNRKRASKKLLATILSLCMSVGMMPVSSQQVYADEEKWTERKSWDSFDEWIDYIEKSLAEDKILKA